MEPYYQDEFVKVYHASCLDVLPTVRGAALIMTDPPYGVNYNDGDLASVREAVFGGNKRVMKPNPLKGDGPQEADMVFYKMLLLSKACLIKGGVLASFCIGGGPGTRFAQWIFWMDKVLNFMQAIVWNKPGLGMGMRYRRNYEFILMAQNGAPLHCWNGGHAQPNVWTIKKIIPQQGRSQHPTEKPVEIFERIIMNHSNPGDLVVDPFTGSGASLVAAKRLGRKAIGIELDEKWCFEIRKRLRATKGGTGAGIEIG